MTTEDIKLKINAVLGEWMQSLIVKLQQSNPDINSIAATYLNKGLRNIAAKSKERIDGAVDGLMTFIGDEHGNVDVNTFLSDAVSLAKSAKPTAFSLGPVALCMGGGNILRVEINNPIASFLMGGTTAINVSEDDIMELASMLSN